MTSTDLIRQATEFAPTYWHQMTQTQHAAIYGTPDQFQLTATRLISDATATAIALIDDGCTRTERIFWDIYGNILISGETDISVKSYMGSTWVCDDGTQITSQTRPVGDYFITFSIPSEELTNEYTIQVVEVSIQQLLEYPQPEDTAPPIIVDVTIITGQTSIDEPPTFLQFTFTYDDAISAYESGLRGQALLDELNIELPE